MKLILILPHEQKEYEISWIELPVAQGTRIIQHGHEPTLLALSKQKEISFALSDGTRLNQAVSCHGIAQIERTRIIILVQ